MSFYRLLGGIAADLMGRWSRPVINSKGRGLCLVFYAVSILAACGSAPSSGLSNSHDRE